MYNQLLNKLKILQRVISEEWLAVFYILNIVYFELVVRVYNAHSLTFDFVFPMAFGISAGMVLALVSRLLNKTLQRIALFLVMTVFTSAYITQLCYYSVFHMPFTLYSMTGVKDAIQFGSVIFLMIKNSFVGIVLLSLPAIYTLFQLRKFQFKKITIKESLGYVQACAVTYL